MEVASIILSSLTLASTTLTPLIIASAYLISHVKKSNCCFGSGFEVDRSPKSSRSNLKDDSEKVRLIL